MTDARGPPDTSQRQRRVWRVGIPDGRSGAVAIVQRFGAALNVNVHTHALVLDGVFAEDERGELQFHPAPPPDAADLEVLVATLARRILRLLVRRRVLAEEDLFDPWVDGLSWQG